MINFAGIASVVLFYLLILGVGMWAARKNTGGGDQEVSHLDRRVFDWKTTRELNLQ